MTTPVWPADLPCGVILGSLQSGPRGKRLATAVDTGPPKTRRRGPNIRAVQCAISATSDQRARFDRFWDEDTLGGTRTFLFRDQFNHARRLLTETGLILTDENGREILIAAWWRAKFGQQEPAYSRVSAGRFQISFDLIVLP